MQQITSIPQMTAIARELRSGGKRLALVPTMGALHEGHLSLVRKARSLADAVVVSIFVNPMQFRPYEDFSRYPRDSDRDLSLLHHLDVKAVFVPSPNEIYPPGFATAVEPGPVGEILEGAVRPGHFRGVATVVLKLFHIVAPDIAVFGQKDFQQTVVIRRTAEDLNLAVRIILAPVVRDKTGLALSSRNACLSAEQLDAAGLLHQALTLAQKAYWKGELGSEALERAMRAPFDFSPLATLDYAVVADPVRLKPVEQVQPGCVALIAARVDTTRLIDNLILGPPEASPEQLLEAALNFGKPGEPPEPEPANAAEKQKLAVEVCRDCAAISSIMLPPREFLARFVQDFYPYPQQISTLVIGRDAPWNARHYIYRNPQGHDLFLTRLYTLLGIARFSEFSARFALTDALRCHSLATPIAPGAWQHCARHLPGDMKLFPQLHNIVLLGDIAYQQFYGAVLGRTVSERTFVETLEENGWALEDLPYPGRWERSPLRVITCHHPALSSRTPCIAHLLK